MELTVGKWGNSLALRLPAGIARQLGLQEGSRVQAEVTDTGELLLTPPEPIRPARTRDELMEQLRKLHAEMPVTQPVERQEWSRY